MATDIRNVAYRGHVGLVNVQCGDKQGIFVGGRVNLNSASNRSSYAVICNCSDCASLPLKPHVESAPGRVWSVNRYASHGGKEKMHNWRNAIEVSDGSPPQLLIEWLDGMAQQIAQNLPIGTTIRLWDPDHHVAQDAVDEESPVTQPSGGWREAVVVSSGRRHRKNKSLCNFVFTLKIKETGRHEDVMLAAEKYQIPRSLLERQQRMKATMPALGDCANVPSSTSHGIDNNLENQPQYDLEMENIVDNGLDDTHGGRADAPDICGGPAAAKQQEMNVLMHDASLTAAAAVADVRTPLGLTKSRSGDGSPPLTLPSSLEQALVQTIPQQHVQGKQDDAHRILEQRSEDTNKYSHIYKKVGKVDQKRRQLCYSEEPANPPKKNQATGATNWDRLKSCWGNMSSILNDAKKEMEQLREQLRREKERGDRARARAARAEAEVVRLEHEAEQMVKDYDTRFGVL